MSFEWTQLGLSQEGVQLHLELLNMSPKYSILLQSATELGWVPSEGWELYALYHSSSEPVVCPEPVTRLPDLIRVTDHPQPGKMCIYRGRKAHRWDCVITPSFLRYEMSSFKYHSESASMAL